MREVLGLEDTGPPTSDAQRLAQATATSKSGPEKDLVLTSGDPMVGRMRNTYQSHFATCRDAAQHRKTESKET